MLTEHPLLSEPSSVSFYNWMSNAVGNRSGGNVQESPLNRSQHNSLQTGGVYSCVWEICLLWQVSVCICVYMHTQVNHIFLLCRCASNYSFSIRLQYSSVKWSEHDGHTLPAYTLSAQHQSRWPAWARRDHPLPCGCAAGRCTGTVYVLITHLFNHSFFLNLFTCTMF